MTGTGAGFTVIVKTPGEPLHPPDPEEYSGVTVIVANAGSVALFTAVKAAMSPVPLAASPICVLELVQWYDVPGSDPVKFTGTVDVPPHTTCHGTQLTDGVGLTVMVKVVPVPWHKVLPSPNDGRTVMVATIGIAVWLAAINGTVFPVPEPASPMDVLLLVQL